MCVFERCTVSRTARSCAIFARVARDLLCRASILSLMFHLLLLRFLERDLLARVAHALALVRLRRAITPHFRRDLADHLLVRAFDDDLGLRRRFSLDAFRQLVHDWMRE